MKISRRIGLRLGSAVLVVVMWGCGHSPRPEIRPAAEGAKPLSADRIATNSAASTTKTAPPVPQSAPAARTETKAPIPASEKLAAVKAGGDPGPGQDQAAALLEEALTAYQEARRTREKDDLDGALKALDAAYDLLLKADVPPDSPLYQEKADLRLLVAQRIQEIYASRRVPIADNHKSIPLTVNKYVQREIDSFLGPERKFFEEAYRRSGLYRGWIQAELRQAGLPEELVWLAMIESWFMPRALSYARALGMWQFIASTGYRYGLTRDRFIDERMDPVKSTRAAIGYLTDLHALFGDWSTALAAYNCGEGFVQRCIAGQKTSYLDDFWDLFSRLPFQTARYVPRFIAAVLIVKEPARFGVVLPEPYPALAFETVTVDRPAKLDAWAAAMGLEAAELLFLNPELRIQATPDRPYPLRVPTGGSSRAQAAAESLPRYNPPAETVVSTYVVRAGDTLSAIAAKYGTSIPALQKLNGLKGTSLVIGQRIRVQTRG
ncbi:MAG: transglycosylase SLT domain-containing protein [Candidatus Aminicenantes bacterium]|nr:transglycosylase SLT domain-containing protein [Candidatus Aminicenantes bacterium]